MDERVLAEKLKALRPHMNERQWRLVLGAEAQAIGRGGIAAVTRASGAARSTVMIGAAQIRSGLAADGRVRGPGGGRPATEQAQPGVEAALEGLVDPESRGDPMSALRWTTKSLDHLVGALAGLGFVVSAPTVRRLLRQANYRLQSVFKTKEGAGHPDRDAQFRYINAMAGSFLDEGQPVVSVDCKKKELVGEYAQGGREWQPAGRPVQVNGHDFPGGVPKAIPYGVYDVGADEGFVSVGVDHDTAPFAVNTIRAWWQTVGRVRYPRATKLMITADGGGSNGYRLRLWKLELARFANECGLEITVCHYPPGTSKWNRVEHRLFSFISINWRGRPLTDYEVVVEMIANTRTDTGLTVSAMLDTNSYPIGIKVSKAQMAAIPLTLQPFHGEWNYIVHSGLLEEPLQSKESGSKRAE